MKNEIFRKYVEGSRDCDAALLDIAVNRGLHRAKGNTIDYRKLINLAAAFAATAALCFVVSMKPVRAAAAVYMRDNSTITESGEEALSGYLTNIANTIIYYLGGN